MSAGRHGIATRASGQTAANATQTP